MRVTETVLVFVINFFLLVHAEWSIRCYGCTGFNISRPLHRITNNPACTDGNFDYRQVQVYTAYSPGFSCYSFTYNTGLYEITQRYMVRSPLARLNDDKSILPRNRDGNYRESKYSRDREYREREYREREGRQNTLGIEGTIVRGFYCHTDYCNGARRETSPLGCMVLLSIAIVFLHWLC